MGTPTTARVQARSAVLPSRRRVSHPIASTLRLPSALYARALGDTA